jgi:CBS domain-containing protein
MRALNSVVIALRVSDIVARPLITIPSDATVLEASKRMIQNNIGLLVICDSKEKKKLFGVVSERDIIRSIASGEKLPDKIGAIGTKEVVTVNAGSDVAEAAKAMNKHRIRHVVVVDERNTPNGVVSMRDLVGERATLRAILQAQENDIFVGGD